MNVAARISALVLSSALVVLAGCGAASSSGSSNTGSSPSGQLATGGATSVYVIQNTNTNFGPADSILQFNASSNGNVSPAATLYPPPGLQIDAVATDSAGQIYVAGGVPSGYWEIVVYPAGATGSATPLRTIAESVAVLPTAIAVDSAGLIYVAGAGSIAVFSATANGVSTPTRLIQGTLTQMSATNDIAVDPLGNIYIANTVPGSGTTFAGLITIFAPGATGNTAPVRVISSSAEFEGIALDSSGNIYTNEVTYTTSGSTTSANTVIAEFSNAATGAATPTKTIAGSATGLGVGGGLGRDGAGNLYLVNANLSGASPAFNVLGFGPTAQGDVAPGVNFASNAWTIAGSQIALK